MGWLLKLIGGGGVKSIVSAITGLVEKHADNAVAGKAITAKLEANGEDVAGSIFVAALKTGRAWIILPQVLLVYMLDFAVFTVMIMWIYSTLSTGTAATLPGHFLHLVGSSLAGKALLLFKMK